MTTIAYKAGIMACDSAWTNYTGSIATHMNKITRLSSGALVGEAGDNDSRAVRVVLDRVKTFDKMPTAKELIDTKTDYSALIAFPNGEVAEVAVWHDEDVKEWRAGTWKVNRGIAAVGSGSEIALGFMGGGGTAAAAVNFVCSWDPASRLPVHVMHVKPKGGPRPKLRASGQVARPR